MVDLELTVRCFYGVSFAYNSIRGIFAEGERPPPGVVITRTEPDPEMYKPVKSVYQIAYSGLEQFKEDALATSWNSQNFDSIAHMHSSLIDAGYDYSTYFKVFGVTSEQCLDSSVSYPELGDLLEANPEWTYIYGTRDIFYPPFDEAKHKRRQENTLGENHCRMFVHLAVL